jgi:hypothetical protein
MRSLERVHQRPNRNFKPNSPLVQDTKNLFGTKLDWSQFRILRERTNSSVIKTICPTGFQSGRNRTVAVARRGFANIGGELTVACEQICMAMFALRDTGGKKNTGGGWT